MPKAKNLKTLRKAAKLTQEQFADAIGVSKRTVHAWETRERAIPMPSTKKIADYFGMDYQDFCDHDVSSDMVLTEDEIQIIEQYRGISDTSKAIIMAALDTAYKAEL